MATYAPPLEITETPPPGSRLPSTAIQAIRTKPDTLLGANPLRITFLVVYWLVLSMAASWRWLGWGRDYGEYFGFYDTVTPYFGWGYSRFESGYELSAFFFANYLNAPFPIFYFFMVLFALGIKFFLLWRYSGSPVLAAIAYTLLLYPIHEYTQIRAAVAIALAYWAVHFLLEKRLFRAATLMIIAFTFHSSIVVVGVVALVALYIPVRLFMLGAAATLPFFLYFSSSVLQIISEYFSEFNPLVDRYVMNSAGVTSINIFALSNVLYMLTALWAIGLGWFQKDRYHSTFLVMCCTSFVFQLIFMSAPVLALRTGEMLVVAALFMVFRQPTTLRTAPLQALMILNGLWFTYRAIGEGTLGG